MAIYHLNIQIISRSAGRSVVAAAAYRSGSVLHDRETDITHDFSRKSGIIYSEIDLPENAPDRFYDREILWNAVQRKESRKDAQFAREIQVALPKEFTREQQIECLRNYIQDNFVRKGMIADWSIHDMDKGNPHCHILLTLRGFNLDKEWNNKRVTFFANDRNQDGKPIYNPEKPSYQPGNKDTEKYRIPALDEEGNQKKRVRPKKGTELIWERISIPLTDWDEHVMAEEWRRNWAKEANKYLPKENQIDHRSFERQGLDRIPTIYEGFVSRQMEKDGLIAPRCQTNREIREANILKERIKQYAIQTTKLITEKVQELYGRFSKIRDGYSGKAPGDTEPAGRNNGYVGNIPEGSRGSQTGEEDSRGNRSRTGKTKLHIEDTDRKIAEANRAIEDTDRTIEELKEQVRQKQRSLAKKMEMLKKDLDSTKEEKTSLGLQKEQKESLLAKETHERYRALYHKAITKISANYLSLMLDKNPISLEGLDNERSRILTEEILTNNRRFDFCKLDEEQMINIVKSAYTDEIEQFRDIVKEYDHQADTEFSKYDLEHEIDRDDDWER